MCLLFASMIRPKPGFAAGMWMGSGRGSKSAGQLPFAKCPRGVRLTLSKFMHAALFLIITPGSLCSPILWMERTLEVEFETR